MLQRTDRTNSPTRNQIPRVRGADIAPTLARYRQEQRPLILEAAAADWPAVKRWTPAYLAEVVGDIKVVPSVGLPDTEVPYNHRDKDFRRPMTVREFVDLMATGDRCYIDQVSLRNLPGLEHDFDFESLSPPDVKDVILWMGSNTRSGMHYDNVDNLFAQVHGTKLAILAAPEERKVSMRMSLGSILISTSSASGSTATVMAEVCTRPCCSVTGTRCTRCTPLSYFSLL